MKFAPPYEGAVSAVNIAESSESVNKSNFTANSFTIGSSVLLYSSI